MYPMADAAGDGNAAVRRTDVGKESKCVYVTIERIKQHGHKYRHLHTVTQHNDKYNTLQPKARV